MNLARLQPRVAGMPYLGGIDAGGTKFLCAIGRSFSSIDRIASFKTESQEKTLSAVVEFFGDWIASGRSLGGIGVSSFGPLNRNPDEPGYGMLRNSPKPGWATADILGYLRERVAVPSAIDTDVNGAALAEGRWGAARASNIKHFAYVTVGTGIGVGIVNDDRLINGVSHPELGHYEPPRAKGDRFRSVCPFHPDGCLEGLASGPTILKRTGQRGEDLPDDHPVWSMIAHYLGHLSSVLILSCSCQRIIFGGGVMNRKVLLPMIRREAARRLGRYLTHELHCGELEDVIVPSGLVIPQQAGLSANAGVLGGFILAEKAMCRRQGAGA